MYYMASFLKDGYVNQPQKSARLAGNRQLEAQVIEDYPKALNALFQAAQVSSEDFRKLEPWYSHAHSLALKFFRHLTTVQQLCVPRIDATTGDAIVDHSSVISVGRAAYETFLVFAHLFGPEDPAIKRLRFALWSRAGLIERSKYAVARTPDQAKQLDDEQTDIQKLFIEIENSPLIGELYTPKERARLNNGEWTGIHKTRRLAKDAGIHEEYFGNLYSHSSGHSHSSFISALQVTLARDLGTQLTLARQVLSTGLILIAHFLKIFCKMSPKAADILKKDEEAQIVLNRWYVEKEEWALTREARAKEASEHAQK